MTCGYCRRIDTDVSWFMRIRKMAEATQGEGQKTVVTVIAVDESGITVDANHPLVGENLIFDLDLVEIA